MSVDPSKTMMLIAAWPDRLVAPELIIWAMWHKFHRVEWYCKRFIECAYNSAIAKIALPGGCDHFIFADRDIRPGKATEPFLGADGELVACEYRLQDKAMWGEPQSMHTGLWRCDRKVLESIKPPWFHRVLNADGTDQAHCLCKEFRLKANAAGFTVVRAGWAEHDMEGKG